MNQHSRYVPQPSKSVKLAPNTLLSPSLLTSHNVLELLKVNEAIAILVVRLHDAVQLTVREPVLCGSRKGQGGKTRSEKTGIAEAAAHVQ